MAAVLLDTHTAIWFLGRSPRLSAPARSAIHAARDAGEAIFISSVSLVEMVYLTERGTIPVALFGQLLQALQGATSELTLTPFDLSCAAAVSRVPREVVPDMPDRMLAATALHLGIPLVTKDARIRSASIPTIW